MNTKNPTGPVGLKSHETKTIRMNVVPSGLYNPKKKTPSRRDKHRLGLQNKSPHKQTTTQQQNETKES